MDARSTVTMLNDLPMGSRLAHHRGLPALNRMLRFPLAVNARAWNTPTMLAVVVARDDANPSETVSATP